MPTSDPRRPAALALTALVALAACATDGSAEGSRRAAPDPAVTSSTAPSAPPSAAPSAPGEDVAETPSPAPAYVVSDGRPRDARMSIPELDIADLRVEAYRGHTDDAAGHAIQNTGIAASPFGPRGGVGPGGVGNYQVTGHRTSSTRILEFLPDLGRGDRVVVRAGGVEYVYEIRGTRITSFRSARSLAEQRAAVPGRPGATPVRAMITISTCRTQEDHAEGNYWSDEFDNPEHRIDKIGVLVRTRPA
ncbi:sortase domain-containing protein [Nocardioides dongxiaopingii]|uniref:sortase domain-containing protein n=2 Tax=Nocardioides TaxID=1839 RepID=UPI0021CB58D3|nr:sortase [Nocardioides sp. S-1144]